MPHFQRMARYSVQIQCQRTLALSLISFVPGNRMLHRRMAIVVFHIYIYILNVGEYMNYFKLWKQIAAGEPLEEL